MNMRGITSIKQTTYKVGDRIFLTLGEAKEFVGRGELLTWAAEVGLCSGSEWTRQMVLDQMIEDAEWLVQILDEL